MTTQRSKKYQKLANANQGTTHAIPAAVELTQNNSYSVFVGRVELHLNVNIDPSKSDQRINFNTTLPYPTGKEVKVAVLTSPEKQAEAQKAGAAIVGGEELISAIKKGVLGFDILIATPEHMPKLAEVAAILGPKGLMPNPKNNTVTDKLTNTIADIKKGQINIRLGEKTTLHLVVGSVNQAKEEVVANIEHVIKQLNQNKPAKIKGKLIKSAYLAPTMGPSCKLDLTTLQ